MHSSLPDWVRQNWIVDGGLVIVGGKQHSLPPKLVEQFSLLLDSPESAKIWSALERRRSDYTPSRVRPTELRKDADQIIDLAVAVHIALDTFRGARALPATERKKRAKRIADSARALSAALNDWTVLDEIKAGCAVSAVIKAHPSFDPTKSNEYYRDLVQFVLNLVPDSLNHLASHAEEWGNAAPAVDKPGAATAARTYFLKSLGAYLQESYGTPLHSVNLAIASQYFDCSTLSEAEVSPVVMGHIAKVGATCGIA